MSTSIEFTLTEQGNGALFNAQFTGLSLELTHIQIGDKGGEITGVETILKSPRYVAPISAGMKITNTQIRMSALFTGLADQTEVREIGIWAGEPEQEDSVLFAYYAVKNEELPIAIISKGVDFTFSHDLSVSQQIGESIEIIIDEDSSTAIALLEAHNKDINAHPELAKKSDLLRYIPFVNRRVDLPKENIGTPIHVVEYGIIFQYIETPFFKGYRNPLVGTQCWITGNVLPPCVRELDGEVRNKADFPGIWAYAQENGQVVTPANYKKGWMHYADLSATQFRMPNLSDVFIRATGTDVDTAKVRAVGSHQEDAFQGHVRNLRTNATADPNVRMHGLTSVASGVARGVPIGDSNGASWVTGDYLSGGYGVPRVSSETRSSNTAMIMALYV